MLADSPLEELAVGAVNLSFALELYLKALLVHFAIAPPTTHRLRTLFDTFPPPLQSYVREAYRRHLDSRPEAEDDFSICGMFVSPDPDAMEKKPYWADDPSPSLEALLDSHQDAFVQWRYGAFEMKAAEFGFQFNFRAFTACIDAVRDVAWAITDAKGERLNREEKPNPLHWPALLGPSQAG